MQYHAFLSYSHRDAQIMRRVHSDLEQAGLNIWTDESLVPGTLSWKNAIEDAIQNSLTLVVLLSPDSKHSDWVEKEVEYATACHVKILPILVRGDDEISAIPFELINVQRIDLRHEYDNGMTHLITTIKDEGDLKKFSPALSHSLTPNIEIPEALTPISFYDHVRLFIWLFWQPEKLVAYRQRYGDESLRRTTAWVVGDLAWIAFLAPAIGIILGTVHVATDVPLSSTGMQALSGVVFIGGWFMTGAIGWRDHTVYGAILLVGTSLIIFGLFAAVNLVSGVALSQGGGMTRIVFLTVTSILLSSAAGIGFRITPPATATVGGLLIGSLLFNATFDVQLHLDGGIGAFIIFANAILVAWVVDNSLKTGTRTPWHVLSLAITIGAGAALILTYFLGGWIFLQGL